MTEINHKNEEYRRKLKEAAEKIGMYFDMRIKILYKRFGADINRQLVDLAIVMPWSMIFIYVKILNTNFDTIALIDTVNRIQ